jgi:hypothetical protein
MPIADLLVAFATAVRADRAANPGIAGDGTALELLIAPRFRTLVEESLAAIGIAHPPAVLPEYTLGGVGRPDLAFARTRQPARAFIELKEPRKLLTPTEWRGHDADQFRRFGELPLWGLSNFAAVQLYRRSELVDEAGIVPALTLEPTTPAARAERLIRDQDRGGFERILLALATAEQPAPKDAEAIAQVLAHAARLVREVVLAQCVEGLEGVLADVRADFNETLFARAEAGGYDTAGSDALFASAFAQTLIFGLLLAREAGGGRDVGTHAYQMLPAGTYPLLRGTLRALTQDEVLAMLGVAFDVGRDAVNSVVPDMLAATNGRDPLLYLYEDFLRVFDPEAAVKYGVYYTPPDVVRLIVAETERTLQNNLGTDGFLDAAVQVLDPACGTGTFLIGAAGAVADRAAERFGSGAVPAEITGFAQRMHGFELLVGPYTVAHYRMLREIVGHGGTAEHLPIYLADTLAPPAGAEGVVTHLAFMGAPMVAERRAADAVKQNVPILAIFGNPPYRRLRRGEIARLVGADMERRWQDLTQPVRDAGFGRSLNAFPDLYIAFYRWALWRLFEAEGACGRGVLAFITNRGFLTGRGFGGLRQMLRRRFDAIRVLDLRGDSQGTRPATVTIDENVFNIQVGVCILVAYANGGKPEGAEAEVSYSDVWTTRAFTRTAKLELASRAAAEPELLRYRPVPGSDMDPLKPPGFAETDWPGVDELLTFRSNGIVTYRDDFVYATAAETLANRIQAWLRLPPVDAAKEFKETRDRKSGPAVILPFDQGAIERVSYRPLDLRHLYNRREFIDFPKRSLQTVWGASNVALFAAADGIGAGPAVWCHGLKPDQHAFRGSYGGWVFPLHNHNPESRGHFLTPALVGGLAAVYGTAVAPQDVFDAILALLSASTYTTRFAFDLEDDFPHVPFPADPDVFAAAAEVGARIRALEGFTDAPGAEFRTARLAGHASGATLDVPTPQRAFVAAGPVGTVGLLADRSLMIADVPQRVWDFSVSGYQVLYRWLRARKGEGITGARGAALLREALDVVWRITELLALFDRADAVLGNALAAPLTRADLDLPSRRQQIEPEDGDNAPD